MQNADYDIRQLRIMQTKITDLIEGRIDLEGFINDQWALIDLLKSIDHSWKENYRHLVNSLEVLYASSLDENRTFTKQEEEFCNTQIKRMSLAIENINK